MSNLMETEFGKIEYTIRGKGQPIVFLHGGHSNCHETLFHKGYDKSQFQLITPSRPGYGKTPLLNNQQPGQAAKLIASMLHRLQIQNGIVVGISAGGLTAIELTALLQNEVEKLVLISAVTKRWLVPNDDLYKRGKKIFSPGIEKLSWMMFRLFFKLLPRIMTKILFEEISSKKGHQITADEIKEIREMTFRQSSGHGFAADLDHDIEESVLTNIQCPTLMLHSENDNSVPLEMAKYANKKIANSILKTYDNKWGHLLWVGQESDIPINDVNRFLANKSAFE